MYNYLHPKNCGETENAVDDNTCVQNAENKMKTQSSSNKIMPRQADCSSSEEYDEKYKEIVEASEGFISSPCSTSTKMGSILPCPVNALVKKAANFAIEEHNKKTGANIELSMVVKANMQFLDDGLVFYLTLQTLDGDHIVFKEAKVCEYIDTDHCYELSIFRNAIYYDKIKVGIKL
ncbi:hypothetical protein FEM48_Zijuj03G0179200 [Ziziphus jujuba var. spinosa]|uniref:Cystatin domain-containing protein n=1 Tax=Ziziphus jujuba var. spinosa TaxID=714518 RepID=A0A978VRS4_ZIZJJ|nr:hypothetical protein FEM48_Zijuj03G0179200 [Ziziphus jujuba var. spinosa]